MKETLVIKDCIAEIAINLNVSREKAVVLAVNLLNLVSKVPEYRIAFIDSKGNVVEPVELGDLKC